MDGLALFCNLHADGPRSLERLRAAGLRSLAALEEAEPGHLAQVLGTAEAGARRLVQAARALRARIEDAPLEPELRESAGALELPEPAGERPPPAPPRVHGPVQEPVHARRAAPAPLDPAALERPLRRGEIEGLDGGVCERLVRAGVRTYGALIELAGLSLARRADIAYPRLLDLAYRARRRLRAEETRAATLPAPGVPAERSAVPTEQQVVLVPRPPRAPGASFRAEPVFRRTLPPSPSPAPRSSSLLGSAAPPAPTPSPPADPGVAGPFV